MCGITGAVGHAHMPWMPAAVESLRARGPDEQELWTETRGGSAVALGHARLSVIDPEGGKQPMHSDCGRYVLVYNGELYNFQALRQILEGEGLRFRTRSDTEVLLKWLICRGVEGMSALDGMFAFCLWDRETQTAWLGRDRLGIKPLFYALTDGLVFGSTLAPFWAMHSVPHRGNLRALRDYLAYQTPLVPDTFLSGVWALEQGSFMVWRAGQVQRYERYWSPWTDISPSLHTPQSSAQAIECIDTAMRATLTEQVVADVPLGVFLSGGIDSSLIAAYATQARRAAGAPPIRSFNVQFEGQGLDETPYALAVAAHLGTEHTVLPAPIIDASDWLQSMATLDQPIADPAFVSTYVLSRLTRQHVTVALSGDGGDELFGGYPRYRVHPGTFPRSVVCEVARWLLDHRLLPGAAWKRGLAGLERLRYQTVEAGPYPGSRKDMNRLVRAQARPHLNVSDTLARWSMLYDRLKHLEPVQAMMQLDWWTYLSDNCLVKSDRSSMAFSLELRVPLLSNRMVECAKACPAQWHINADEDKRLLRQLARHHLPPEIIDRKKHGFSVPVKQWMQGPWSKQVQALLQAHEATQGSHNPLDSSGVSFAVRNGLSGKGSARLSYTVLSLLAWQQTHAVTDWEAGPQPPVPQEA